MQNQDKNPAQKDTRNNFAPKDQDQNKNKMNNPGAKIQEPREGGQDQAPAKKEVGGDSPRDQKI